MIRYILVSGAELRDVRVLCAAREELRLELVDLAPDLALVGLAHGVQRRQGRAGLLRQGLLLVQPASRRCSCKPSANNLKKLTTVAHILHKDDGDNS